MTTAIIEQGREWARGRTEGLTQGVSALETQVAELELIISRTPALLRALGKYFYFGPAEELGWVRFKLGLKLKELGQFEAKFGALGGTD